MVTPPLPQAPHQSLSSKNCSILKSIDYFKCYFTSILSLWINSSGCSWPFDVQLSRDGWTNYGCIDVRTCVNQDLPSSDTVQYDSHKITNVRFNSRRNFFIDNLAFARSTVQSECLSVIN